MARAEGRCWDSCALDDVSNRCRWTERERRVMMVQASVDEGDGV